MRVGVQMPIGHCAGSSGKLRAAMKPSRLMFFTVLTVGGFFNKSVCDSLPSGVLLVKTISTHVGAL